MNFTKLPLEGAIIIEHQVHKDHRGSFTTTFCKNENSRAGIDFEIVQSSFSYSEHIHTLRGMHFQTGGYEQKKLVKCIRGKILDVIIDLREDSKTFGQHYKVELSYDNNIELLVPEGFAHGFLTLEPNCYVFYQFSNFYNKEHDNAVRWNDPFFGIEWPVSNPILSEKDANHPDFKSAL